MSDYFVKIVPKDQFCQLSEQGLKRAEESLKSKLSCDSITAECYDTPQFIDCGSDLERITCPECGADLDFGWWQEAMDHAYESHFMSLEAEMPCCRKMVSLNNLEYYFPCAFACCEIIVLNPNSGADDAENDITDSVQKILGTDIRIIRAHI